MCSPYLFGSGRGTLPIIYSLLPARQIQHIISYPPQDILFLLRPATATIFNQVGMGDSILLFNPFSNKLYLELSSIDNLSCLINFLRKDKLLVST